MAETVSLRARGDIGVVARAARIDLFVAVAAFVLFVAIEAMFQYRHVLGEPDLYRVLVGLLDGLESGRYLNSPVHYDRDFGFGYLAVMYRFVDPAVLRDPDRMTLIMNQVGLWALIPGLPCLWAALRLVHGSLVATVALIVFAFSPMMLELGTSGHPVLPMFAFLSAAALCLFLPMRGWSAVLAGIAGALFLLCGLLCRGEIFLAFPWLVLSRIDTRSFGRFMLSGVLRSLPPVASLVMFFVLQQSIVHAQMGQTVGHYFFEFYAWATVIPGAVYMAVGCGLATATLGLLAAAWLILSPSRGLDLLGPLALTIVPLAFFLPNPQPTRHFMMVLLGFGILLGMVLARRPALGRAAAFASVVVLVLANHALAELARPFILHQNDAHSPYLPTDDAYRTTTHANIGWFWQRHAALIARRARWQAFGDQAMTSCDADTLILSDEGPSIFSRLYVGGVPVTAERFQIGKFLGFQGSRGGRNFIVLEKLNGWPADPVATVLADPALDRYKLLQDPWTMSHYDRTPIPPDRAAHLGCAVPNG
ncbi:MAG: hypothetical protein P4L71_11495 [Acetobacteraceae bacterium]|nr:hypothetical protein [Acetobacteraceae bacterium]